MVTLDINNCTDAKYCNMRWSL